MTDSTTFTITVAKDKVSEFRDIILAFMAKDENNVISYNRTSVASQSNSNKKVVPKPENANKPWTDEDRINVLTDYKSGMNLKMIADKYKRSANAVLYCMLPKSENKNNEDFEASNAGKHWTKDQEKDLVNDYNQHVDYSVMSQKYGRTKYALECKLVQLNVYKFS